MARTLVFRSLAAWMTISLGVGGTAVFSAPANWKNPKATLKLSLQATRRPSHPSAGYFIVIPDGGTLPGPRPEATVYDANGKALRSAALWHNQANGLALVFEAPDARGAISLYLEPAQSLTTWSPETRIYPGPVLCTNPERASMGTASGLSSLGPVDERVHFQEAVGTRRTPLCIRGDQTGRPRPASFYLLAHLMLKQGGQTWVAPFYHTGEIRTLINGQTLRPRKRNDKWGGVGQALNLEKGIQRIEVLAACPGTEGFDEGQGVMWMAWKTPGDTAGDLGGLRPSGVPYAGTPAWESRMVRDDEILRSGSARITEAESAEGAPPALASIEALEIYWKDPDSPPVFLYQFKPLAGKTVPEAHYSWRFDRESAIQAPSALWLFPGTTEQQVQFRVALGNRESTGLFPFYTYAPVQSSLGAEDTRRNFQNAFVSMLRAYPEDSEPTARWTPEMWHCFMDVQALGEGGALLADVHLKHWDRFKRNLSEEQQARLQDLFFHFISGYDPDTAEKWLKETLATASGNQRRVQLRVMLAELYMYHRNDFSAARSELLPLLQVPGEIVPQIRLGDLAFLEGDLNEASRLWGRARERSAQSGGFGSASRNILGESIQDWKKEAVQDTRLSMTVLKALNQHLYDEALAELRAWERNFPHTKIGGDFIVQEARLFMSIGNLPRAIVLLEAYCNNIDASSYLPEAAEMLLAGMLQAEVDPERIRKFATRMKEQFKFHPLRLKMERALKNLDAEGEGS